LENDVFLDDCVKIRMRLMIELPIWCRMQRVGRNNGLNEDDRLRSVVQLFLDMNVLKINRLIKRVPFKISFEHRWKLQNDNVLARVQNEKLVSERERLCVSSKRFRSLIEM
jgi:hypothetical protein